MCSPLRAFTLRRCLRVWGKAMLTNRARARVRVNVGRETRTTALDGLGQKEGYQGTGSKKIKVLL